ncbi:MAG: DUF1570 domain-containing protein [Planctomycetota bacterium]
MLRTALTVALLCAPVLAQGKVYESPQGFRLKLPRDILDETPDPKDRIVKGKFRIEVDDDGRHHHRAIWIVRYRKAAGITTGGGGGGGDDEGGEGTDSAGDKPQSLKDRAAEAYNKAHSLQELLDLRFREGTYSTEPSTEKPIKFKDGTEARVFDGSYSGQPFLRAYLATDGIEEFGLIGLGARDKHWDRLLEQIAESLEFFLPDQNVGDAPVDAALRNPDFRRQVRQKMQQGWDAYDTENFILITNCKNGKVVKGLLTDLEIMRKCYTERFPPINAMEAVSLVRVFQSYEEYAAYGKLPGAIGHFSPLDDELVLFDPGKKIPKRSEWLKDVDTAEVLYHEAMHQYLHEANGMLAPASWFNEGFGEVFAGAVLDRRKEEVKKIEKNRGRMTWIKRSKKSGGWPDLRAFVKMTQPDFYGPSVYQNYAFAWAFCHFLEEERQDPKGNKEWGAIPDTYLKNLREITAEYRAKMPEDAPKDWIMALRFEIQEKAFDKTFTDTDWSALEKAWIDAMKKW